MARSRTIALALAILLLATCGLSALVLWGTVRFAQREGVHVNLFGQARESARVTETLRFDVDQPASLEVDTTFGDVTVEAGGGGRIEVALTKRAWGTDAEGAAVAAEALTVETEQRGNAVKLRCRPPERIEIGGRRGSDRVDFKIRVPTQTAVTLVTGSGDVQLTGTSGAARITADFGDVAVHGLDGSLVAKSRNGNITVEGITAGDGDVELEAIFGKTEVDDVSARIVHLTARNGRQRGSEITARRAITVENQFGDITLENVRSGTMSAETRNGQLDITNGRLLGRLVAKSDFGAVRVAAVEADSYRLFSRNGSLSLEGARGSLDLESEFGGIIVSGAVAAVLDLRTGNGGIEFAGSLDPATDHAVHSNFGDIQLTIPADSSFDAELETTFGHIESDLPITLSGEIRKDRWRGRLNEGGARLSVTTRNGSIELRALTDS